MTKTDVFIVNLVMVLIKLVCVKHVWILIVHSVRSIGVFVKDANGRLGLRVRGCVKSARKGFVIALIMFLIAMDVILDPSI